MADRSRGTRMLSPSRLRRLLEVGGAPRDEADDEAPTRLFEGPRRAPRRNNALTVAQVRVEAPPPSVRGGAQAVATRATRRPARPWRHRALIAAAVLCTLGTGAYVLGADAGAFAVAGGAAPAASGPALQPVVGSARGGLRDDGPGRPTAERPRARREPAEVLEDAPTGAEHPGLSPDGTTSEEEHAAPPEVPTAARAGVESADHASDPTQELEPAALAAAVDALARGDHERARDLYRALAQASNRPVFRGIAETLASRLACLDQPEGTPCER